MNLYMAIPQVSWCIEVDNMLECKSFSALRALQRMLTCAEASYKKSLHAAKSTAV